VKRGAERTGESGSSRGIPLDEGKNCSLKFNMTCAAIDSDAPSAARSANRIPRQILCGFPLRLSAGRRIARAAPRSALVSNDDAKRSFPSSCRLYEASGSSRNTPGLRNRVIVYSRMQSACANTLLPRRCDSRERVSVLILHSLLCETFLTTESNRSLKRRYLGSWIDLTRPFIFYDLLSGSGRGGGRREAAAAVITWIRIRVHVLGVDESRGWKWPGWRRRG